SWSNELAALLNQWFMVSSIHTLAAWVVTSETTTAKAPKSECKNTPRAQNRALRAAGCNRPAWWGQ
ncbi:MAG: hypothetical protein CMH53_03425, partial [Myxococcales bacterium]|nr:hypothetical protein [Myxococcales bacterium]